MTFHLTDLEVVDALDGQLAAARQPHLRGCTVCQAAVAEARATLGELDGAHVAPVPEPGPEFWATLTADVRARVAHESIPQTSTWWQGSSAGWGLLAAAAALLLAVWLPGRLGEHTAGSMEEPPLVATVSIDDVRWQVMTHMLADLPDEDVVAVLAPSPLAVAATVEDLSSDEVETFRRLLESGLNQGSY